VAARKSLAPETYNTAMPYLRLKGAAAAIEFYKKAFGAKKRMALQMGDRIGHAEIEIGGSVIMMADEFPEMGVIGPKSLKGTTVTMVLYVADVDKAMAKAVAAGATVKMPATDMFYGARAGTIVDPCGHEWMLQKEILKLTPRELQKRMDKMMAEHAAAATAGPAKKKGK
jgi:PhnB protein